MQFTNIASLVIATILSYREFAAAAPNDSYNGFTGSVGCDTGRGTNTYQVRKDTFEGHMVPGIRAIWGHDKDGHDLHIIGVTTDNVLVPIWVVYWQEPVGAGVRYHYNTKTFTAVVRHIFIPRKE